MGVEQDVYTAFDCLAVRHRDPISVRLLLAQLKLATSRIAELRASLGLFAQHIEMKVGLS